MEKKKLFLMSLVALFVFAFGASTEAAPVTMKIGLLEPPGELINSPYHVYTSVMKNIVEGKTAGRIKIQVFDGSQLGDNMSMVEQTQKGVIQMAGGADIAQMAAWYPNAEIVGAPYCFQSTEVGRVMLNGWFGRKLADAMAAKSGIRILSYLPNAFRTFSNSKREIRSPSDMKGLRFRVQTSPLNIEMVKALGASPTPIPYEELYSALQTGVVDGHDLAPYVVVFGKLYEVQKFMVLDNHTLNVPLFLINEKFYKGLPAGDRMVIDAASRQAAFSMLGLIAAKEPRDLDIIQKEGVKVYTPTAEEYAQFQKATREPCLKLLRQKVEEKWVNNFFKAIDETEKQLGLKK
jgi:tripartite ATP-independent transporter DctP family solute receptor